MPCALVFRVVLISLVYLIYPIYLIPPSRFPSCLPLGILCDIFECSQRQQLIAEADTSRP